MANLTTNILHDNNHGLERAASTLDPKTELGKLDALKNDDNAVNEAQNRKIEIKTADGKQIRPSALDIIKAIGKVISISDGKNYAQEIKDANIELKYGDGKIYKLDNAEFAGRGSELMAYLQLAAGKALVPDGKFGARTAEKFREIYQDFNKTTSNKTKNNAPENLGEIGINLLSQENFYDDFITLLGQQAADKYKDIYKLFKNDGSIRNLKTNNIAQTISMEYCYSVSNNSFDTISVRIQDIQNPNKNIDKAKFVQGIVEAINKNEARLYRDILVKSIEDGVKNIPISKLSYAQFDYIKANGRYDINNNTLDFDKNDINSTGMTVEGDNLVVKYGNSALNPAKLNIDKISTDHKFDQAKFIAELQNQSLTKLAQGWLESRIRTYKSNGDTFPLADTNYLLLNKKIENMKKWLIETKAFMEKLENTYKLPINPAQKETFKKQIASIEARIWLDDYYRMFQKYTTTTHTPAEMTKTEAEFRQAMTNVIKKKSALETYKQGSFEEYMNKTYRTIYTALRYTE